MDTASTYVITIGRELGSGGKQVGELLGQQLGIPVYDRRLINLAAQEQGFDADIFQKADEIAPRGSMGRLFRAIASPFSTYRNAYDNPLSHESLFSVQTDIIQQKAATECCIIVGRCSDYILRNHPRHFSLFIRADMDDRVKCLRQRFGITDKEAQELIAKNDRLRADHHDFYAESTWADSRAYDLCVNVSRLGIERTATAILPFIKAALDI